jgi:NADP-dependent 3-hydroxy acid dehydrogenase YdfG
MAEHVRDRVVVVTGAGSGFGRLVAEKVAQRGGRVVAADVDGPAVQGTVDEIVAAGGDAVAVLADVTDLGQMRALALAAVAAFGRIDVMVNNAGIMPLAFYADHAAAAGAWDRCIDVNLKGVLHGIIAVHDQMIEQGRGQIVNISSIYGNTPTVGAAVYAATKAAVNVLSEALRAESQGRIKVTTVKPTGVPGTGLGGSIVNGAAVVGLLGQNADSYWDHIGQMMEGTLPAELTDPDDIRYWAISPDELADQVLWVIDQPWGVSISDVTVRASGEEYLF